MGLFGAAAVIGLLDGFNPCAMWVLIYLISLASTIGDKRKMYIIVGGKYTTFRTMAQEISREIVKNQNLPYNPDKTKSALRKNCQYNFFNKPELTNEIISKVIKNELPRTYQDLEERRIHSEDFKQKLAQYFTKHTI